MEKDRERARDRNKWREADILRERQRVRGRDTENEMKNGQRHMRRGGETDRQ